MLLYEYKTVDRALKALYSARKQRNPRYSLRSFAKTIQMSPSSLSSILAGKQNVSPAKMREVADKLGVTGDEQNYLVALAELSCAKSPADVKASKEKIAQFGFDSPIYQITKDQVEIYGSWEALAIIEALKISDAQRSAHWLATALEIPLKSIESICAVLTKHHFIVQHEDGTYSCLRDHSSSEGPVKTLPPKPIRQFHASIMQKAMIALDEQPLSERDISTMIYASSASSTPQVKQAIKEFRRALMAAGESVETKDSVYCLAIQWFKLAESPARRRDRLNEEARRMMRGKDPQSR